MRGTQRGRRRDRPVGTAVSDSPGSTESQRPEWQPTDGPNQPIGVARGIHPGRVVWVRDTSASSWDGETGYWWEDRHTSQAAVSRVMSNALQSLTGEQTDEKAWDALFRHFNATHGRGERGYRAGEKVAIKLNMAQVRRRYSIKNQHVPSPQLVYALLWQLVRRAGVRGADITCTEPSQGIPDPFWNKCHDVFPEVTFEDTVGKEGRTQARPDLGVAITFSEEKVYWRRRYIASSLTEADYVINLALLRGHSVAGVTLCGKNHCGSIWTEEARWRGARGWTPNGPDRMKGLHGYFNAFGFDPKVTDPDSVRGWNFPARTMDSYNALVDLMGHKDLDGKTLLFMIDGLHIAHDQGTKVTELGLEILNGGWPCSLFVSQDGVAIDSVALDFLRSVPALRDVVRGIVDNYLHEAALAYAPPSGTFYDPEGDGTRLESLGVHEHWNNARDRQYSRNLERGTGIELVADWMSP